MLGGHDAYRNLPVQGDEGVEAAAVHEPEPSGVDHDLSNAVGYGEVECWRPFDVEIAGNLDDDG